MAAKHQSAALGRVPRAIMRGYSKLMACMHGHPCLATLIECTDTPVWLLQLHALTPAIGCLKCMGVSGRLEYTFELATELPVIHALAPCVATRNSWHTCTDIHVWLP